MPKLTRWTIRLAMIYLLLGLGGWLLSTANQAGYVGGTWYALRPISIHWLTIGWLTQLIFAVIYWMFPIITREQPYGTVWVAWFGLGALNIGLLARAIFELGLTWGLPPDAGWGLVGSAMLQWSGASAFVFASWSRIRERGGK